MVGVLVLVGGEVNEEEGVGGVSEWGEGRDGLVKAPVVEYFPVEDMCDPVGVAKVNKFLCWRGGVAC